MGGVTQELGGQGWVGEWLRGGWGEGMKAGSGMARGEEEG